MSSLLQDIESNILSSDSNQRLQWVHEMVNCNLEVDQLYPILKKDDKASMRCLWLIGDIADNYPEVLFPHLHDLYNCCSALETMEISASFSKFWHLCGIPKEDEVKALNLLFKWLDDSKSNVTTKSRVLFALEKMSITYPDIKTEFISIIENQLDKNSKDFRKRAVKILDKLR